MEDKKNNSFSFARPARVPVSVWSFSSAMSSVSERTGDLFRARIECILQRDGKERKGEREKDHQRSKREGARNTNDAIRAQGKKAIKIVSLFFGSHFFFLARKEEKKKRHKGREKIRAQRENRTPCLPFPGGEGVSFHLENRMDRFFDFFFSSRPISFLFA